LIDRPISAANERGVTVSFDVNVRRGLLDMRDPREVLGPLAARADLLFLSEDEPELLFGGSDPGYVREAQQDIRAVAVVVHRAEGAFAVEETGVSEMAAYPVDVVDIVGAGTRSSPVFCRHGCGGGTLGSVWTWRTPAERARLPYPGT
jgi:2-dehydro-3-deoxygluconokinase